MCVCVYEYKCVNILKIVGYKCFFVDVKKKKYFVGGEKKTYKVYKKRMNLGVYFNICVCV